MWGLQSPPLPHLKSTHILQEMWVLSPPGTQCCSLQLVRQHPQAPVHPMICGSLPAAACLKAGSSWPLTRRLLCLADDFLHSWGDWLEMMVFMHFNMIGIGKHTLTLCPFNTCAPPMVPSHSCLKRWCPRPFAKAGPWNHHLFLDLTLLSSVICCCIGRA